MHIHKNYIKRKIILKIKNFSTFIHEYEIQFQNILNIHNEKSNILNK